MKEITREDERKLFEAYETLDKILNNHNLIDDLCKEKIKNIFIEVRKLLCHIVSQIYACAKMEYYEQSYLQAKLDDAIDKLEIQNTK